LSLAPEATREALALAVAYVGAFLLLRAEARRRGGRHAVVALLTLSGVGLAALGVAQHLTQPDPEHRLLYWTVPLAEVGTPFGPYVNRNQFAGAMAILAAIAAGEAMASRAEGRRGRASLFGGAAALEVVALCATTSKGGIAGAAVATALLWASLGAGRRLRGLVGIAAGAAGLAAVLAWTGALGEIAHRFAHFEGRWMGRFQVQADAVRVFLRNPWSGTGAGSFEAVYPAHQTVCDDRAFDNAHSDWAQFLMETGLLGVLAAALVVRAVLPWARAGARAEGAARWRVLGPLAGVAACVAHGFVDVGLHIPANALLTVSALSLASAAAAPADESARAAASAASAAGKAPPHGAA